jgi:predicted RNA-binding protein with PIN domain
MLHIVIDGYNHINRTRSTAIPGGLGLGLELARREFLDHLVQYKQTKRAKITVVFDAYKSISLGRQRENYKGIEIVYSRENETADDVIIGWIREKRSGMVVVTSDRAIIDEAKRHGISFLTPLRLEQMIAGMDAERQDDFPDEGYQGTRKGNPRRLPKKVRKALKPIHKL